MKMKWLLPFALIATLISCNDDLNQIGSSIDSSITQIVEDSISIEVLSTESGSLYNRTITQLLGSVSIPDYGTVRSDFLTMFYPSTKLDTSYVTLENIDSLVMKMRFGRSAFTGDSLAPMQVSVYKLNKRLKKPLYSDIDPRDYYDPRDLIGRTTYTAASDIDQIDTARNKYYKTISVTFPKKMAQDFYLLYKNDPAAFSDINTFADKFLPGVYVTNTYGSGAIVSIQEAVVDLYYKKTKYVKDDVVKDSLYSLSSQYLTVTPEVLSVNHIQNKNAESLISAIGQGEVYLKAPAGYDVQLKFPIQNIIDIYLKAAQENGGEQSSILNAVNFTLPVYTPVKGQYNNIEPPRYLLFVRKKDKLKFFTDGLLPDGKNYFYAEYNNGKYNFGNIRGFITNIIANQGGKATADDEEILLVPVYVYTSTSDNTITVTDVVPYIIKPAIVKVKKDDVKVKFIYTNLKN